MSEEALHPEQFFHGTISPLKPGSVVEPVSASSWRKPRFPNETHPDYAYATSQDKAWDYAEKAWHSSGTGTPRVFQVEPLGEHEPDPRYNERGELRDNWDDDRRSKAGWRVLNEVQMPEHMGTPEDWR